MYKPDSNELTEVHQFDNVQDVYVANDRLYILDRSSNITIYNLLTQQEEKKLQYGVTRFNWLSSPKYCAASLETRLSAASLSST